MRIGFVGLSHMGPGMAANLFKAGHEAGVDDRSPEKAASLVAPGASTATAIDLGVHDCAFGRSATENTI